MNKFEQHISDVRDATRLQIESKISELNQQADDNGLSKDKRFKAVFERMFWEKELSKIYKLN